LIKKRAIARQQRKAIATGLAGIGVGLGAAIITYKIIKQ